MKTFVTMLFLAALTVGILAALAPESAPTTNPQGPCIIRCFEGHCERCCKERGQWVCS